MNTMKKNITDRFLKGCLILFLFWSCGKDEDVVPIPQPPVVGGGNKSCSLKGISQFNSGTNAEFSLTGFFDNDLKSIRVMVFDSVTNRKVFDAPFIYSTADSITIDTYRYVLLDGNKRVKTLVTPSDLSDPVNSDQQRFEYTYDTNGFLIRKSMFLNGSKIPDYTTDYSYTNNLLTGCVLKASSAGDLKLLESVISYSTDKTIKNWIYTFPDAFESFFYSTVLNFGVKPLHPVSKMSTTIFNPADGTILDTWVTNFNNYLISSDGYVLSGTANGDLQQGMVGFYGKTNFYYQCK